MTSRNLYYGKAGTDFPRYSCGGDILEKVGSHELKNREFRPKLEYN